LSVADPNTGSGTRPKERANGGTIKMEQQRYKSGKAHQRNAGIRFGNKVCSTSVIIHTNPPIWVSRVKMSSHRPWEMYDAVFFMYGYS
jgi:hypothetical protein